MLALLLSAAAPGQQSVSIGASGTLRIVHVSDTHYHPLQPSCKDVPEGQPCSHRNTTTFLESVLRKEQPHLVAYTGDIIDGDSKPPKDAMDDLYGVAITAELPWAASLGNHDEESFLSRDEVMQYITNMPRTKTEYGPIAGSPGNFYIDVLANATTVARLVFFDSRIDHVNLSINNEQVAWFENITASLPPVPTLAFYHIPLREYQDAIDAHQPISGAMREPICDDLPNPGVFQALQRGGVVAGFCGHDHTNDFCVRWPAAPSKESPAVNLCYEGSPGLGAYGSCDASKKICYMRRARVTELQLDATTLPRLRSVRSWKRVDAGGSIAADERLDDEVLWSIGEDGVEAILSTEQRHVLAAVNGPWQNLQPKAFHHL